MSISQFRIAHSSILWQNGLVDSFVCCSNNNISLSLFGWSNIYYSSKSCIIKKVEYYHEWFPDMLSIIAQSLYTPLLYTALHCLLSKLHDCPYSDWDPGLSHFQVANPNPNLMTNTHNLCIKHCWAELDPAQFHFSWNFTLASSQASQENM